MWSLQYITEGEYSDEGECNSYFYSVLQNTGIQLPHFNTEYLHKVHLPSGKLLGLIEQLHEEVMNGDQRMTPYDNLGPILLLYCSQ